MTGSGRQGTAVGAPAPLLPVTAEAFRPHPLHAGDRSWTETNCYVDVWIEVLHALGLDPLAAAAFTLSCDYEVGQWSFFKYPPEDLRALYGLEVTEYNVWRPVVEHVVELLAHGRLTTVEADSWFLPDTRGVAYRTAHVKSTIVPNLVDLDARRLGYFHNAGYFELEGDDFDGVFRLGPHADPVALPPYVEQVRLDGIEWNDPDRVARAVAATTEHLARRPADNPFPRMAAGLARDLPWLSEQGLETFHLYAFGICRQCGASAELAASFVDWLNLHDGPGTESAAVALRALADGAKALQFALARVVRGRTVDLDPVIGPMADRWEVAMGVLVDRYGR